MRKSNFLFVPAVLCFMLSISAQSWGNEAAVSLDDGIVAPSEADTLNYEAPKDDRLLNLKDEYEDDYNALISEIQAESDPLKKELLQKEVQALKEELEIKYKEIQLEIAIEQGDEIRELEILDALELLYEPKEAKPSSQEPFQEVEDKSVKSKAAFKNPDDA